MGPIMVKIVIAVIALAIGALIGYIYRKNVGEKAIGSAEQKARNLILDAENRSESMKKEAILEAKEEAHRLRSEAERDARERRAEIQRSERRLIQKEESMDRKLENIERKEESITQKEQAIINRQKELELVIAKQMEELERISGYTAEEAKTILLANTEKEVRHEASVMIKEIETKAKEEADKKAKYIITGAIQRCAADHVAESTVSVVALPNDEMKGRIIGREGRNIRAIETLTGVDLIIDDTPEAITLSSFDPVRREIARISLEKLIADGRIHPTRIEEMVEKAKAEVAATIKQEGERAMFETGVHGLNPELVKILGRMRYRTSYGQNVLNHSIEVAHIAGLLAAELGADVTLAKRAGLLHDIGKAIDHQVEGPHAVIGADLARRYGESPAIVHAIESHHNDVDPVSVLDILVQAADAVSAARPGARRESAEAYIKRLEKLEEISNSHRGVERTYAMQAGREIRVMVKPEEISDAESVVLAHDIATEIEEKMEYPGQVKVVVIRESRATDIAK